MLYFSLPNFYENIEFNKELARIISEHPDMVNDDIRPCRIESCYGNFPYSFWNGDVSTNCGDNRAVLYDEAIEIQKLHWTPVTLDCSNIAMIETDFLNYHLEMILDVFSKVGNTIKISNLSLMEYISSKYTGYYFILSKNTDMINSFENHINSLIEENRFDYIEIPDYWSEETIKGIKNKNKVLITLDNKCRHCSRDQQCECKVYENINQISYSNVSVLNDCVNTSISVKEEFDNYRKLGFTHFQFQTPSPYEMLGFKQKLLDFFIKPEYHRTFVERMK